MIIWLSSYPKSGNTWLRILIANYLWPNNSNLFDNLIEMVNVLGSLFYGTILGIFIVAFFFKKIKGGGVFYAALIAEAVVLFIHFAQVYSWPLIGNLQVEYLWYNVIGAAIVVVLAHLFTIFQKPKLSEA